MGYLNREAAENARTHKIIDLAIARGGLTPTILYAVTLLSDSINWFSRGEFGIRDEESILALRQEVTSKWVDHIIGNSFLGRLKIEIYYDGIINEIRHKNSLV
jgi:hypothetical protein